MNLVDRHRRAAGVDPGRRTARPRHRRLVEHDRCGLGADLRGEGEGIGLQGKVFASSADNVELVVVAGAGTGMNSSQ